MVVGGAIPQALSLWDLEDLVHLAVELLDTDPVALALLVPQRHLLMEFHQPLKVIQVDLEALALLDLMHSLAVAVVRVPWAVLQRQDQAPDLVEMVVMD